MCSKTCVKVMGFICLAALVALAIVGLVLGGLSMEVLTTSWRDTSWNALGVLKIVAICYIVCVAILGIFVFWCANKCVIIIFCILFMISIILSFAVSIFALVGGSVNLLSKVVGCNSVGGGFLDAYNGIDALLINVDKAFCSSSCGCLLSNTTSFSTNTTVAPYYLQWKTSATSVSGFTATAFQNCSYDVRIKASRDARAQDTTFDKDNKHFIETKFYSFFAILEEKFKCTGWCTTTYTNSVGGSMRMFKYLFTNINKGVPLYQGCMKEMGNWLPSFLKGYGAIILVVACAQLFVWILAIVLCYKGDDEPKAD